MYIYEISSAGTLQLFTILGIVSVSVYNIAGVTVTKHISAVTRSICDATRVVIVWSVGALVSVLFGSEYPNYKWELLTPKAIAIEIIGFCLLICGNLIYHGLLKLSALQTKKIGKYRIIQTEPWKISNSFQQKRKYTKMI